MSHIEIYLVIALAIQVFGCWSSTSKNLRPTTLERGYQFQFKTGDRLNISIVLKNIPLDVDDYTLNYQVDYTEETNCTGPFRSPPTKGVIQYKDICASLEFVESIQRIKYYIELYYNNGKLCSNKTVVDGVRMRNPDDRVNLLSLPCSSSNRQCHIEVDIENKCDTEMQQDLFNAFKCIFTGNSFYTCEYDNFPVNTSQRWHQVTKEGIDIGIVTQTEGSKSQFIIKLMKFDNNTSFFIEIDTILSKFNTTRKKVKLPKVHSTSLYNTTRTIYYTEFQEVNFDCNNYLANSNNTQVGLIDPSGENISTLQSSTLKRKFHETDDHSILCCIYFIVDKNSTVSAVKRFVEKLSLLKYKNQAMDAAVQKGLNESDQKGTDESDQKGTDDSDQTGQLRNNEGLELPTSTYYIIGSVVGTIVLLVLCSTTIKKLSCRKQRNTNQNRVLYAELDIQPSTERQVNITEESPYAEIIGVLKPAR